LQNPKQDGTKVKLFLGVSAALIGMSAALSGSTPAVKSALHHWKNKRQPNSSNSKPKPFKKPGWVCKNRWLKT
jgi:hypothetical protein